MLEHLVGGKRQCADRKPRKDSPNEAKPLVQCSLSRKKRADQKERFSAEFTIKRLDYLFLLKLLLEY